jgi:hypothetical protein
LLKLIILGVRKTYNQIQELYYSITKSQVK